MNRLWGSSSISSINILYSPHPLPFCCKLVSSFFSINICIRQNIVNNMSKIYVKDAGVIFHIFHDEIFLLNDFFNEDFDDETVYPPVDWVFKAMCKYFIIHIFAYVVNIFKPFVVSEYLYTYIFIALGSAQFEILHQRTFFASNLNFLSITSCIGSSPNKFRFEPL